MAKVLVQHSSCESSVGLKLFSLKVAGNDLTPWRLLLSQFEYNSEGDTMKMLQDFPEQLLQR